MATVDNDERLEFDGVVDPFMDVDWDPDQQTGSDWYALALTASLGSRALHGFTFATTTETVGKTTFDYAAKHTVGWVKTNEPMLNVEHPGDEWDEVVRPTRLHTGVVTGSQLSLMFDTDTWEPASATRARNTAFLAAGMVANGLTMREATDVATAISGEEVPESAVVNTLVPVSHLKREAAGVAKSSHAIFSRMNAQRYISWQDNQLHQGILPYHASLDWAKVTVVARYLAEANIRYDPNFRKLAQVTGVPYTIVKGSWAYIGREDYVLKSDKWAKIKPPDSQLVARGALATAYAAHTERLTTQVMRTYNELASDEIDTNVDSLLRLAENLRTRRAPKRVSVTGGTDMLADVTGHQQSASVAAQNTATAATAHNALSQAFTEMVSPSRELVQKASYIIVSNRRYDDMQALLTPFYPYLATRHTWVRAFEILDALIGNARTSLDRMNRLHRSMTQSSQTIQVDVPLTAQAKHAMGPHIVSLLKKMLVRPGPTVALPRYVTSISAAVQRGDHARLLRAIGDHLTEYKEQWANRYEDWARTYALSKTGRAKSVIYGAASSAFRNLKSANLLSPSTRYIDGADVRSSYLYRMASDYARKRRLNKPMVPIKPISGAKEYAEMLDKQYNAPVPFSEVEEFVHARLHMFAEDLAIAVEPLVPDCDDPDGDTDAIPDTEPENTPEPDDDLDLEAELLELMGPSVDVRVVTYEQVLRSYPDTEDPNRAARVNGYSDLYDAFNQIGEKARWDTETDFTRNYLANKARDVDEAERNGLAIR